MDYLISNNVYIPIFQAVVLPGNIYKIIGSFAISANNQLIGAIWITKNGQKILTGLGSASFEFFDQLGVSTGISQSGITANANSDFIINPQSSTAILDLSHYTVKLQVFADNLIREGQVGVPVA